MISFSDRMEAGQMLAQALKSLTKENPIIVALPRGGLPVAGEIAKELKAPLDFLAVKKIGAPGNPEFALGAVSEDGEPLLSEDLIERFGFDRDEVLEIANRKTLEAREQARYLRAAAPPIEVRGRTVILVDDGLATGSTMEAAVRMMRKKGASKVIVAIPVASTDAYDKIGKLADKAVSLLTPPIFYAVGAFYDDFSQISDAEAEEILRTNRQNQSWTQGAEHYTQT